MTSRAVVWLTALWLAVALVVSGAGVLRALPFPGPQLLILTVTIAVLVVVLGVPSLRRWAAVVDPRAFVVLHLGRFVGFYFLYLYGRGELPYAFAVPGGWGDNVVAAGVVVLLLMGRPTPAWWRRGYLVWNVVGFADIVMVVITAARIAARDPSALAPLTRLPLALLPTFLVPAVIATHVLLFWRLWREAREGHSAYTPSTAP
jgi:hypothetical protein